MPILFRQVYLSTICILLTLYLKRLLINIILDIKSYTHDYQSMALTSKQAKFVASYQINPNATQSAINAGYPEKTASSMGWQLLKNPKIQLELTNWKSKKAKEFTKEDYIDTALNDYRSLELAEPNKPRFLDIAGKALGYIGANGSDNRPNQSLTININNVEINGKPQAELWDLTRKLIGE